MEIVELPGLLKRPGESGCKGLPENIDSKEPELLGSCFKVLLEKRAEDEKVGLDVQFRRVQGVKVFEVHAVKQGLIHDWNQGRPQEDQVKAGDALVSVNSQRGNGDLMVDEMNKKKVLELGFVRGAFA